MTILAIAGFAGAVALGLVLIGPWAMDLLFDDAFTYGRWGLAVVALGMGAHLTAGTLNQAALARDRAGTAAACWLFTAAVFVAFMVSPLVEDELVRAEVGYFGAAALLCALLAAVYRARRAAPERLLLLRPGHVGVALLDQHGLALDEVAHRDLAALDAHERAGAAVLGQPLRALDGGGAVLALRAEAALAVAPQPPDLLLLGRGGRLLALLLLSCS